MYAVIMAGGSGTRFWPLSRRLRPKQFLAIGTETPLIVETVNRLAPEVPLDRVRIVAGAHHADGIRTHLPGLPKDALLIEPCARNTAPCLGLAAIHVAHEDPDAVMAVLPADHHIGDQAGFHRVVNLAAEAAAKGEIVTLGIAPTRPETGYGYIEVANAIKAGVNGPLPVTRFVEKPNAETAATYLSSGRFLWNSGMFFLTARRALADIERFLPRLHAALGRISAAIGTPEYDAVLAEAFATAESISIDYGIMEHATGHATLPPVKVVPADIEWNDVGHWAAIADYAEADADGNVVEGDAILVDTQNTIVHAAGRMVAVVGLQDVVVVETEDAVLVCPRDRAQDVREIVARLREADRTDLL